MYNKISQDRLKLEEMGLAIVMEKAKEVRSMRAMSDLLGVKQEPLKRFLAYNGKYVAAMEIIKPGSTETKLMRRRNAELKRITNETLDYCELRKFAEAYNNQRAAQNV